MEVPMDRSKATVCRARFPRVFAAFQCQVQAVKCSFFAWSWWKSLEMALLACFFSPVEKSMYIHTTLPAKDSQGSFIHPSFWSILQSFGEPCIEIPTVPMMLGQERCVQPSVISSHKRTASSSPELWVEDQWDCHAWGTIKAYGWLLGQLALFQRAWMWLNEADRRYASILEKSRENESG